MTDESSPEEPKKGGEKLSLKARKKKSRSDAMERVKKGLWSFGDAIADKILQSEDDPKKSEKNAEDNDSDLAEP